MVDATPTEAAAGWSRGGTAGQRPAGGRGERSGIRAAVAVGRHSYPGSFPTARARTRAPPRDQPLEPWGVARRALRSSAPSARVFVIPPACDTHRRWCRPWRPPA